MRAAAVGHVPQLMPMPYSIPSAIGDWQLPPWGQATLVPQDVVDNAWNTWATYYATALINTLDTTDPLGGNTAAKLTESGLNQSQFLYRGISGLLVLGPRETAAYFKAGSGTYGFLANREDTDHRSVWDLTTGALTAPGGKNYDHFSLNVGSGWWYLGFKHDTDIPQCAYVEVGLSNAAGDIAYLGTGKSLYVWNSHQLQTLCSGLSDVQPSRTFPAGKTGPFNMLQAAAPNQPFYRLNGERFEIWNPNQSATYLVAAFAELAAFLDGTNTPFALLTTWRTEAGATTEYMQPGRFGYAGGYAYNYSTSGANNPAAVRVGNLTNYISGALPATVDTIVDIWMFDGADGWIYRNGRLVAGPGTMADTLNCVGNYLQNLIRQGALNQVALWPRSLSLAEIAFETFAARRKWRVP